MEMAKFQGNYIEWIKDELSGWSPFPWALYAFGLGFELAILLTGKLNPITIITFIATAMGMLCTVAMSNGGKAINGLLGAISVIGYCIVNWQAGHWFSIVDQLTFFALIDVPLMIKWRTYGRGDNAKVKGLPLKGWVTVSSVILLAWFAMYHLAILLADSNPLWDSLALAIGGTASVLCVLRYTETYNLWLISDLVNIALWFSALRAGYSQAALPMLVMTLFYLATAIYGRFFTAWNGKNQ